MKHSLTRGFLLAVFCCAAPAQTVAPASAPTTAPAMPAIVPIAHVEQRGAGPIDLVLIPGLSCNGTVYDEFMAGHAGGCRMFAVTLPGFGGDTVPAALADAPYASGAWIANAEAAVLQFIREKQLKKPVVIGHSMGGTLALKLARDHGSELRCAIAIDSLPLFPPPRPGFDTAAQRSALAEMLGKSMGALTPQQWAAGQVRNIAPLVRDPARAAALEKISAAIPASCAAHYMADMIVTDLRPELRGIKIPALVINAIDATDAPTLQQTRDLFQSEFTDAPANLKRVVIEGSRHFIMFDRPAELNETIEAFLNDQPLHDFPPASQPTTNP